MILFENHELVVIQKPSGIASAHLSGSGNKSAIDLVRENHYDLYHILKSMPENGLVHRLDYETSGALAFAKTHESHIRLRKLWNTDSVTKTYRALVPKSNLTLPKTLDRPIGRSAKSAGKMVVLPSSSKIRGKPMEALTTLLRAHPHPNYTDLEIEIQTGVMHQIRAHLASLKLPILGDTKYKGTPSSRLWLHAWKLNIVGTQITAPLPTDWIESKDPD